jgi:hypothetical protein
MASRFEVELSMQQSPSEAQSHAAVALADPANAVGLKLSNQSAGELKYKPPVGFPFTLALWHRLQGEQMTVTFSPGTDGGTEVAIRGAVSGNRQALASDPEHWSEALGASPPVSG